METLYLMGTKMVIPSSNNLLRIGNISGFTANAKALVSTSRAKAVLVQPTEVIV